MSGLLRQFYISKNVSIEQICLIILLVDRRGRIRVQEAWKSGILRLLIRNNGLFTFILGPSISNAGQICEDVLEDIRPYAIMYEEVKELYNILREVIKYINTHRRNFYGTF